MPGGYYDPNSGNATSVKPDQNPDTTPTEGYKISRGTVTQQVAQRQQTTQENKYASQFGLYDPAANDGRQTHVGFLVDGVQLVDPVNGTANVPLTGAVLRRGQVLVNRLPVTFDPAGAGVSKQFIYR